MNREQARQLIKDTFEATFNKEKFIIFIKDLLNKIEESTFTYRGNFIPDAFEQYISTLERIGKYTDDENEIDLLIVKLKKEASLERARTMQRNFIAWYLNGSRGEKQKDAALVAFVSSDEEDWRFSLVKMDYRFEEGKAGMVKVKEKFTPACRWSFLVGKNEKSHTAQSRIVPILEDDEHNPTLTKLEEAFNIETVTKEFFEKYRGLFIRTVDELDKIVKKDEKVRKNFELKNINTVDFSKKLLGQIVFLYFLQKKGWFGVKRDAEWGTGPKNFLRQLFEKKYGDYKNFFNDILEPLFYEALARERDDNYYSRFNCKIPFLNGGLFEPIGGYDWVPTDINLLNELFSNNHITLEGDTGDGILDIFDRFNFTVKEDEPLEKEVAIDPELLGKLYEKFNAIRPDNFYEYKEALVSGKRHLEKKFNKKFGVYYTPREIVHYMCQQSLINYLHTSVNQELMKHPAKTPRQIKLIGTEDPEQIRFQTDGEIVSKEDIQMLIKYGEQFAENEAVVIEKGKETKTYKHKLPETIRNNAKIIDEVLKNVKICDPAVGSGAFPVGMMSEIVKARNVLTAFLSLQEKEVIKESQTGDHFAYAHDDDRTIYNFKRECIENALYGVDIDPGACEIAKLRLWLSLIVDEEDIRQIKPLPNLDYKIMQGNSLISEFLGINFDIDKDQQSGTLKFESEIDPLIKQFQEKKNKFLNEPDRNKKEHLKQEIESLIVEIFKEKLKKQRSQYFSQLKSIEEKYSILPNEEQQNKYIAEEKEKLYKETGFNLEQVERQLKEYTSGRKIRPFFPWKIYFAEVFHNKGGFDVVIANPPYVRADSGPEYLAFREELKESGAYHTLYEKWDLMVPFIERGLCIAHTKGTLIYIVSNAICTSKYAFKLLDLIQKEYYLRSIDYFDDMAVFEAGVIPVVLHVGKTKMDGKTKKIIRRGSFESITSKAEIPIDKFKTYGRDAFRKKYSPLYFKIQTINFGDICYLSKGMVVNSDEKIAQGAFTKNDLISAKKTEIHSRPYIEGKYIDSYVVKRNRYLEWGTKRVPSQLSRKTFPELYDRSKIMRGRVTGGIYDDAGLLCNDSIVVFVRFTDLYGVNNKSIQTSIKKFNCLPRTQLEKISERLDLKYLLAILNSSFALRYLNNIRRHRLENYFYPDDFRKLPIADISFEEQKPFIEIVDKILAITKDEDYLGNLQKQAKVKKYEHQIDKMVYKLYGLTNEEVKIVENFNNEESQKRT